MLQRASVALLTLTVVQVGGFSPSVYTLRHAPVRSHCRWHAHGRLTLKAASASETDALAQAQEAARAAVAASLAGTAWAVPTTGATAAADPLVTGSKPQASGAPEPASLSFDDVTVKRASKAEEERKRRIAQLREESLKLAKVSRKIREEDEEHAKLQEEAASVMMSCWSSLKIAKSSLQSAQVSVALRVAPRVSRLVRPERAMACMYETHDVCWNRDGSNGTRWVLLTAACCRATTPFWRASGC